MFDPNSYGDPKDGGENRWTPGRHDVTITDVADAGQSRGGYAQLVVTVTGAGGTAKCWVLTEGNGAVQFARLLQAAGRKTPIAPKEFRSFLINKRVSVMFVENGQWCNPDSISWRVAKSDVENDDNIPF